MSTQHQLELFQVEPYVVPVLEAPSAPRYSASSSKTVRWRERAEWRIQHGQHPTGPLLRTPTGEGCRSCAHAHAVRWPSRNQWKCAVSAGPRVNVRLRWPACVRWRQKEPTMSE